MNKIIHIVHTGISGVPFIPSAPISRCLAIYNMLSKAEYKILAINNRPFDYTNLSIERKGEFHNISYQFTTISPYKSNHFLIRRMDNFYGKINEIFVLFKLGFQNKIDFMFFYPTGSFFELVKYKLISILFGFPLICHYVEYRSSFETRDKLKLRVKDFLFDNYFMLLVDGVIPISEFLINRIQNKKKYLPILKIPPVVNFNLFKRNDDKIYENYFLYIGGAGYEKALDLILDAYNLINQKNYYLYLVLHGGNMNKILTKIETHPKAEFIKVFSDLEYQELIQYNIHAKALLIPLSNSIQDKARFPQKIAEYLASKNPIITTNFGEIKYYFRDGLNALVANDECVTSFSEKMEFIIKYPDKAKNIGSEGYKLGLKYFDSNSYFASLDKFIKRFLKTV